MLIFSIEIRMEGIAEEVSVQEDYEETSGEKKAKILKPYQRRHRSVNTQLISYQVDW